MDKQEKFEEICSLIDGENFQRLSEISELIVHYYGVRSGEYAGKESFSAFIKKIEKN